MINDRNGNIKYVGATFGEWSHMWMDGMEEVHAVSWDGEKIVDEQVGYFGSDGQNLCGCAWKVDATQEVMKQVRDYLLPSAEKAYREMVEKEKRKVRKGRIAEVVRGRKIPVGTELKVLWVGERPTYRSLMYSWMNETEEIAGCYDRNGNKVWIKTEYLKVTSDVEEPSEEYRKKWIAREMRGLFSLYGCTL